MAYPNGREAPPALRQGHGALRRGRERPLEGVPASSLGTSTREASVPAADSTGTNGSKGARPDVGWRQYRYGGRLPVATLRVSGRLFHGEDIASDNSHGESLVRP